MQVFRLGKAPAAHIEYDGHDVMSSMRKWTTRAAAITRQRAGAFVVDNAFWGLANAGRLFPRAQPKRHGVERIKNLDYAGSGLRAHRLDVYRPIGNEGPLPVVLYIHGGGFRTLSKDSHWLLALAFARRGYVVLSINYRLAPRHPYPAALEDVSRAWQWVVQNCASFGGDPKRIVLAGESAGANLATALAICTSFRRPEPWAQAVFDLAASPIAALPACGILQVTDPTRFARKRPISAWIQDRVDEVRDAYLGRAEPHELGGLDMADPLVVLETADEPERPLPPMFAFAGTRDLLLDDSRRLVAALDRLGVPSRLRVYEGEPHAFHAMPWRKHMRAAWADSFDFLREHAGA